MKGFIATVEAIFAVVVFLSVILIAAIYFPAPISKNEAYLRALGMDVLSIAEKEGLLLSDSDKKDLKDILKMLPDSVCMEVEVSDQNGTSLVRRPGCGNIGRNIIVTYRTIQEGNTTRVAKSRSWVK